MVVLRETLEASQLLESGHLHSRVVADLAKAAKRRAGPDIGIDPSAVRSTVCAALTEVHTSQIARYELEHLLESIGSDYLGRWSEELMSDQKTLSIERASRVLASHMLDLGFHPDLLHRWVTLLSRRKKPSTLSDLFAKAKKLARRRSRLWTVFVPFSEIEHHGQDMPDQWLESAATAEWMKNNVPTVAERYREGFLLEVEALDPWAAVEQANDLIESLAARVAVGKPGISRFKPMTQVFVAGWKEKFLLGRPRRQIDVHSLHRHNALFSVDEPALAGRLRSAIDLLAPLETGAPGSAVAGGWAAIEAVLARPNTPNHKAARDLAVLVACSFPRAELTPLTYAYERENDDTLSQNLKSASSNLERCDLLGTALHSGDNLKFKNPSDQAAAVRITKIIRNPQPALNKVTDYVEDALLRLYRQRNMVLHAGKTDSVAMSSTLRTVPPLVGAGFDRLFHDALMLGYSDPLRLVARARTELNMCGKPGGSSIWYLGSNIWDLLGPE